MSSEEAPIEFVEITNDEGLRARLLSWGATLVSVWFHDKEGREHDCVLGYDTIEGYQTDSVQMGKTIGRVANRIRDGEIEVNEEKFQVEKNHGKHHIHGGRNGCSQRNWEIHRRSANSVTFLIKQSHELDGYPGDATIKCTYTVNDLNQLVIEHWAETTVPSPIALTNHTYWTLNEDAETCHDLLLFVRAGRYLPVDDDDCPTGDVREVFGTAFNFNKMRRVGPPLSIRQDAMRFDNEYYLFNCRMENPHTGIRLTMMTTYPSCHIYSANHFDGSIIGKGGRALPKYAGLAIEPQMYSCAAHFSFFPTVTVDPATPYEQEIIFTFQHVQPPLIA
ncbi:hypothetical protein PFISCL1PPCAC_2554 [Pristionchus fissidentatus]|uniref:Galactose mutarotase n=1 Tax=Pristionchus fissidentatus TaxID=1538716 RepID=A0AAV5UVF1_9BILA|nr:hypothetical protein PFISCL1PPCAC_2554 [Pristionchus fissidentatus]